MHIPKSFEVSEEDLLFNFIKNNPLGLIISKELSANLIPMNLKYEDGNFYLNCHFSKSNNQIKDLKDVLIVFQGLHSYISPSFYQTKREHGKVVPTWNYSMVQVKGECELINDDNWKLSQIEDLTNMMEKDQEKPWKVSDAPSEFIKKLLKSIIGVKIKVQEIKGVSKMSQNQPNENQKSVELHLRSSGRDDIADLVKRMGRF